MFNTTQACCASLNEKLTKLNVEAKSECTIYRVHEHLRNVNPNAYEPQVIAIGPYHHNKDHLKMMEDHKLRYFQHLIRRKPSNNVQSYAACVGRLEAEARKCYADAPTSLSPSEFIQMLVLDGCFIVELLLKFYLREENDPIFQMHWMIISVQRDLMLFENQLPFFVLCELFHLIEAPGQHSRLPYLLGQFFRGLYPWKGYKGQASVAPRPVKHLLHFIHCNLPPRGTEKKDKDKGSQFMKSATRLEEADVHRSWLPPGTSTEKKDKDKGLQFMESATRLEEANVHLLPPGTGTAELLMACPRLEEELQFMESPTRLEEANVHLLPPGTGRVMACPRLEEGLQFMESPTRLEEANVHRSWLHPGTGTEKKDKDKGLQFKKSATRLEEANVRFKISKPEAALFDVKFENGVMTMAPLRVDDRTESFLRNLIAYEHYFGHDEGNFVTDYVSFLNDLVDSSKDVEILSRNEIVENWLGDVEAVAKMVNKLADSIVVPNASYAEMFENVEKHCRKRRNRWMAMLRRNYLSSPWVIMSLIVGAVLLLLTITQTVCSILQVV